jgi:transcriptional regulator with XRE-family HTH domain
MRTPADFLREEFVHRRLKNPAYSLRAFSRDLAISPTSLSQILNGRRAPSQKSLHAISKRLGAPFDLGLKPSQIKSRGLSHEELRDDEFKLISDWACFAIMNLAKLSTCKSDPKWIAKRLNISAEHAQVVSDRLIRLGYIKTLNKKLVRTKQAIRTTYDTPSEAIRTYHRQTLQNALRTLESAPVSKREFISVTSDISTCRIPAGKEVIRNFIAEMSSCLQDGPTDEVYTLAVQLFPLTQSEDGNNDV